MVYDATCKDALLTEAAKVIYGYFCRDVKGGAVDRGQGSVNMNEYLDFMFHLLRFPKKLSGQAI